MEANWIRNGSLEGSGQPLGVDSASRGSPELPGGARGSPKIRCWRLGGLLGRKVDRFQDPRGVPGGLWGRFRGGILVFFGATRRGGEKNKKQIENF